MSAASSPLSGTSAAAAASRSRGAAGSKVRPGKPGSSARARGGAGTQARGCDADPAKRREEWFRLARGRDGGKDARRQMRRLEQMDPGLAHSFDEFGEDALHYARALDKHKLAAWLEELRVLRLMNVSSQLKREWEEAGGLSGVIDRSRRQSGSADGAMNKADLMAGVLAGVAKAQAAHPSRSPTDAERIAQAFRQDDAAGVRRLLRTEGGKSWARTPVSREGHNQLMTAAFQGDVRMVEALLEVDQGSLAEQATALGFTPLLIAAGAGHLDVVKALLRFDRGRLALQATPGGRNALMLAAERGQNHCVKYLLVWNGGKLAPLLSKKDENALIIAAGAGHAEVVRTLLSCKEADLAAQLSTNHDTAMTVAAENGHAQVVRLLLDWNDAFLAYLGRNGFSPLLLAAREGHVDVLQALLESKHGPQLAKCRLLDGRNALALALEHGRGEAVRLLRAFDEASLIGEGTGQPGIS